MSLESAHKATIEETRLVDDGLRAHLAAELRQTFQGELIGPDSPHYEAARRVWNAMVDKKPGPIARCTCTGDVVAVVNAARESALAPSVRGGGHNVAGKCLTDGGLTIDLSGMRNVVVDPERKLVHAEGGCLLADVDAATAEHALIVPAGIVSETGLAGLALGGGIGWFSRQHGLTCDNFAALEVVLASGQVVEASPTQHPDLFWALRGGGGNFGVVTRFTFHAHDFGPSIRIGVALYHPEDAAEVLREYATIVSTLPRNVGWDAGLKHDMPALPFVPAGLVGKRLLMLFSMWLVDADDPRGRALVEQLNEIGNPCLKVTPVMPFGLGMQRVLDAENASGERNYTKEAHLGALPPDAIDVLVPFWREMPMSGDVQITCAGEAINDTPENGSAFAHRDYQWWLNLAVRWHDAARDEEYIEKIRQVAADLTPWIGTGAYVNMLNFDEMDRVVEAFGGPDKYARLGRIKAQYDPQNLFRINYNITPVTQ